MPYPSARTDTSVKTVLGKTLPRSARFHLEPEKVSSGFGMTVIGIEHLQRRIGWNSRHNVPRRPFPRLRRRVSQDHRAGSSHGSSGTRFGIDSFYILGT